MLEPDVRHAAEVLANAAEIALNRYQKIAVSNTSDFSADDLT